LHRASIGYWNKCKPLRFGELQIDHFVMAITSFEARVRHHYRFTALARCWRLAGPLCIDFVEADTPAAGGGRVKKNPFLAVAR